MSRFGAALVRQKPLQSLLLELSLGLVNSGARQTELSGRLGNRAPLDFQRPQGFVFELQQILGIKEGGLLKERMAHLRRPRVKGAGRLEGFPFGLRIRRHVCKVIYAT